MGVLVALLQVAVDLLELMVVVRMRLMVMVGHMEAEAEAEVTDVLMFPPLVLMLILELAAV